MGVMAGARREGRDEAGRLDRRVRASIFSVGYVSAFEWFKETRVTEVLAMRIAMSDDVVRWLLLALLETDCLYIFGVHELCFGRHGRGSLRLLGDHLTCDAR
jgi:hypothetical protein